jgi:hypothetical protein
MKKIELTGTEAELYIMACEHFGSLSQFVDAVTNDKAQAEDNVCLLSQNLEEAIKIADHYRELVDAYRNMSPPKFTWCWMKSLVTKKPVEV